jgi:pyruvate formate lyase activating enzyme
VLIVRDWHHVTRYRLTDSNACPDCGTRIAGRFEPLQGALKSFGRQRIPIAFQ